MSRYSEAYARAQRVNASIVERARKLCNEAGLDGGLLGIHPHNAMVSFENGQPWAGVDYDKVRQVLWLLGKQFEAFDVVHKWADSVQKRMGLKAHEYLFK